MAQSLSKLYVHIVFHVKYSSVEIREEDEQWLYAYIGSVIKSNGSIPIMINGVKDHIHILCVMSKNIALAKLVEEVKRHSSRKIKEIDNYYRSFAWQGGYGGFSVSPSLQDKTKRYIEQQKEHHKKRTFKEEYLIFLNEYGIEYDEHYVWSD
jgi:REP element-mobilizing transposase RayT